MSRARVFFVHSEVRAYRMPIFSKLHERHDVTFLLVQGTHALDKLPESAEWHYRYFQPIRFPGYSSDVTFGLGPYLISRRNHFEVIILSGMFSFSTHLGFIISFLLGKRIILWDEQWILPDNLPARIMRPYLRFMVRHAHAVIAAGTKAKELYLALGAAESKIVVAFNCSTDVRPAIRSDEVKKLRHNLRLPTHAVLIGYLGRVVAFKNLDALIKAFVTVRTRHSNARLVIVGSGPFAPECQRLIDELGDERIHWIKGDATQIEPVKRSDFLQYLEVIDIFVLPGRFLPKENVPAEAWGLTLNEAASLAKPLLASKSVAAGYDVIVDGQNGWRVDPDDPRALAERLCQLVDQPKLRHAFGSASRRIAETKITYENMANGFNKAIAIARAKQ